MTKKLGPDSALQSDAIQPEFRSTIAVARTGTQFPSPQFYKNAFSINASL